MKWFLIVLVVCILAGCAQQPQPITPPPVPVAVTPRVVCPPDPPPGEVCAPPLVCRDAATWLAMDQRWYAKLFLDPTRRAGIANVITGTEQVICGGPTPVGKAMRMRL